MANEVKQFTIGGVTHDVMDVGARQLIADLQTAINAITSGDTTTAIKTFQEVIDFLDGVSDDTTLIGKLNELRTLISAKVDKVTGKGLSTEDYTTAEKQKLAGLSNYDDTAIQNAIVAKYTKPSTGIPASDIASGVIPDISGKANSADVYTKDQTDALVADAGKVKSVSINNGTPEQPDAQGNVNIEVQGADGKSAYQSYLDTTSDNPKKTEAQWVASLKGEKGDTGATGATGAKGDKGDKGDSGVSLGEVVLEQSAGNSTTSVMSQKAVTDEIEMSRVFKSTYPLMCMKTDGAVISTEKYKKFLFDDLKYVDVTTRFMLSGNAHYYRLQNLFTIAADSSNYISTSYAGDYELTFVNYKNGQKTNESAAIAHSSICLDNHNICFDFYEKRIVLSKCTNNGVQSISAVVDISAWDLSGLIGKDVYFAKKIFSYASSTVGMLFSQVMVNYPSSLLVNDVLNKRTLPHTVRIFDVFKSSDFINTSNNITSVKNEGCTVVDTITNTHKVLYFNSNTSKYIGFGGSGSNVWLPNKNACLAVKFKLLSGTPTFTKTNFQTVVVIDDDGSMTEIQNFVFEPNKEYVLASNVNKVQSYMPEYGAQYMMYATGEFTFEVYDPIVLYPVAQEICAENVNGGVVCGDIPFDAKDVSFVPYINGRPRPGNYAFYHDGEIKFDTSGKVFMWNGSVWKQISNA